MKKIVYGLVALVASVAIALGAGYFPGWPIVGGAANSQCVNYVNGACVQYAPAGPPALTGEETIPADTGNLQGINPATVLVPSSLFGSSTNRLVGGDFTTNLWQRGTSPVSNATPTVATMTADRWWVISPSGTVDVIEATPSVTGADYLGNLGFLNSLEVRRHTGSTGALTCIGQTLDAKAAAPLLGQNAVFSFWAYAPSTYSAAGSAVTVAISYFDATDTVATQAAIGDAGGNSSKAALGASGQSGTPMGFTNATAGVSVPASYGSTTGGVSTIALTATPTRYAVWAPIPTNESGTQVTGVSVSICGTFVASSAVTTDFFEIYGAQLEPKGGVATATMPNGVIGPSAFSRRTAQEEAYLQLAYSYVVTEGAATTVRGPCAAQSDAAIVCMIQYPNQMRIAPKLVATSAGFSSTAAAGATLIACTSLTAPATSPTSNATNLDETALTCNNSGDTFGPAGVASFLWDDAQSGQLQFSAEP